MTARNGIVSYRGEIWSIGETEYEPLMCCVVAFYEQPQASTLKSWNRDNFRSSEPLDLRFSSHARAAAIIALLHENSRAGGELFGLAANQETVFETFGKRSFARISPFSTLSPSRVVWANSYKVNGTRGLFFPESRFHRQDTADYSFAPNRF